MKNLSLYLLLSIATLATTGCTAHNDIVAMSDAHLYNGNFGLIQNNEADRQVQEELIAMNLPTEVEMPQNMNPEWTTELIKEPDAFYANEYVAQKEVITYKYKFDKKFYKTAEWRAAQFDN